MVLKYMAAHPLKNKSVHFAIEAGAEDGLHC